MFLKGLSVGRFIFNKKLIIIGGFIIAALACGAGFLLTDSHFDVKTVSIIGEIGLSQAEIIQKSIDPTGKNIFTLGTYSLEKSVESIPEIASAKVKKVFPDRIEIMVTEHEPVALLNLDKIYGITDKMILIPFKDASMIPDLPIINNVGKIACRGIYNRVWSDTLKNIVEYVKKLRDNDPSFLDMVSEISPKGNAVCFYLMPDGLCITTDCKKPVDVTVKELETILSKMDKDRKNISGIDLKYASCAVLSYRKSI